MTGLWQVSGRSDLSWEDTVRLDLYYVDNWSMVQDLVILSRTVSAPSWPRAGPTDPSARTGRFATRRLPAVGGIGRGLGLVSSWLP